MKRSVLRAFDARGRNGKSVVFLQRIAIFGNGTGFSVRSLKGLSRIRHGRRAITLLEILVVVSIVVVLTSLAMLQYRSTRQAMRLNNGAMDLKSTFQVARSLAISNEDGNFYGVTLSPANGSFWVDELRAETSGTLTVFTVSKPKVTSPRELPDLVRFEEIRILHNADPVLSDNSSETFNFPFDNTSFPTILFSPSGTSDYAVIQLIQEISDVDNAQNFYSVKLFSSTATAKVFANQKL